MSQQGKRSDEFSGYLFFVKLVLEEHIRNHPKDELFAANVHSECKAKWESFTDAERAHFEERASEYDKRLQK